MSKGVVVAENLLKSEFVFIDTSVYQKANFNFESVEMQSLRNFMEEDIVLLISSVTGREVQKHIVTKVRESVSALQSFQSKAMILRNSKIYEESHFFKKIDSEAVANELLLKFNEFRSLPHVENFEIDGSVSERVFDSYFSKLAPFSNEKPKEFSDAFVLETLLERSRLLGKPIYVVSLDKDMKEFCLSNPSLIFIEGLGEYLEMASRTILEAPTRMAHEALTAVLRNFDEDVSSYLKNIEFVVQTSPGAVVEGFEFAVKNITPKNEGIYHVEEGMAGAGVDFDFEVWTVETVLSEYASPDAALNTNDVMERVKVKRKYRKTLELGLGIAFNEQNPSDASVDDVQPVLVGDEVLSDPFESVVIERALVPR